MSRDNRISVSFTPQEVVDYANDMFEASISLEDAKEFIRQNKGSIEGRLYELAYEVFDNYIYNFIHEER